ncbi:MAG TPA: fibronectin type III domain-containing protein, partial [Solirubrobacterales bacterium]|nr:fibronectin type III domain-containing protein [Solirubrobacterales bacterium]
MRRLRPTGIASVAILVVLAVTAAGTAIAYFTTTGTGNSEAKTISALAAPSIASATPGAGGIVTLNWNAVSPPGTGSVSYKVERDNGSAAGTCVSALSVTSCIDTGLEPGTYEYVVTAKWRSWTTSGGAKTANVTVGPIDHFTLSATTTSPVAGAADNLTITAKDEDGGTVTSYDGSHELTFSGAPASSNGNEPTVSDESGNAVSFGEATPIAFEDGLATVSAGKNGAMKLYKSGSTSIGVGDGSVSTVTPLTVTVSPAAAAKFALAAESATPAAGGADNLTITAKD